MFYVKPQQDKGFAWALLVITVLYNMIEASVFMSPAIYLMAWDDTFDITKAKLGAVGSLLNGVAVFTGILVGPLVAKHGCRFTSLLGTGICACGMLSSVFVPAAEWLYLTYGCVAGLGLGLLGLPPIICVQYYFKKKRPFAVGICLTGHSLGILLYLPLMQLAVDTFGWRGALLLHTGLLLQCFALGSLFLPIDISKTNNENDKAKEQIVESNGTNNLQNGTQIVDSVDSRATTLDNKSNTLCNANSEVLQQSLNNTDIIEESNLLLDNSNLQEETSHERLEATVKCCAKSTYLHTIISLWDFSILKNKAFLIYIFNVSIAELCIGVFYKFNTIRALHDGLSVQQAAFVPSMIATVSTCFRVIVSIIANLPNVNRTVICGFSVLGMGVVCTLSSFAYNFKTYAIFSGVFGVFIGTYVSTFVTIMGDIVGVENIAQAYPFLNLFFCVALFANLSIAGLIIDLTGNYDLPFYIFGILACVPGLLFIFMTCIFPELRNNNVENATNTTRMEDTENAKKDPALANMQNMEATLFASSISLSVVA